MNKIVVTSLVAVLSMANAWAEESNTTAKPAKGGETGVKIEDVKPKDAAVKTGEADVDEVITNRKLRAETGSKKKYSLSAALSYSGGSIEKPLAENRPNIRGALGTQTVAAMGGSVGAKYKLSNLQSLSLDFGVGVAKPFHSDDRSFSERSYIDNPGVSYSVMYKAAGIQNVSSLGVTAYTRDDLVETGYQGNVGFQQVMIYDFGGSKFSAGLLFGVSASTFNKTKDKNGRSLLSQQGDYDVGAYPFAEYVINDTFNLRTIAGMWTYEHDRGNADKPWTFTKNKIYQSVGLGISITRDIYLYPNVQFLPENIRADATNVAISTNINL